jgi:hypothetical protein
MQIKLIEEEEEAGRGELMRRKGSRRRLSTRFRTLERLSLTAYNHSDCRSSRYEITYIYLDYLYMLECTSCDVIYTHSRLDQVEGKLGHARVEMDGANL